jgi:hypothetical protein
MRIPAPQKAKLPQVAQSSDFVMNLTVMEFRDFRPALDSFPNKCYRQNSGKL